MEEVRGIYGGREGEWKGRESNGGRVEVVSRLDGVDQVALNKTLQACYFSPARWCQLATGRGCGGGARGEGRGTGGMVSEPGALVASPLLFISVFAS